MTELSADARWLATSQARWFAGKGRNGVPLSITALDWIVEPSQAGLGVRPEVLTIGYPDGGHERYQLLWAYRDGDAFDALTSPDAVRALVKALLNTAQHANTWVFELLRPDLFVEPRVIKVFTGEQSNTNVMLDDRAVLKIFRRLELGASADIELHRALNVCGVKQVVPLIGWLSAQLPTAEGFERSDLAMVTRFIPGAADGWETATVAAGSGIDFTAEAAALGEALSAVHAGLRDSFPSGRRSTADLVSGMTARLRAACASVPGLAPFASAIESRYQQLGESAVQVQRIHGDFHLGQTLLSPAGWYIIDFEGEPLVPLVDRVRPDSVWRDVAGMLRSIDYAAASAGMGESTASAWVQATSAAFQQGYQPEGFAAAQSQLLDAYVLDKAVYETVYETRNRPDWVGIPLRGIESIINEKKE